MGNILGNRWIIAIIIVVIIAALFLAFRGNFGAHVGALGQTASVQVGGAQ